MVNLDGEGWALYVWCSRLARWLSISTSFFFGGGGVSIVPYRTIPNPQLPTYPPLRPVRYQ